MTASVVLRKQPTVDKAPRKPAKSKPDFIDPARLPDEIYALRVAGDCMSPTVPDGACVLADPSAEVAQGDLAIFYLKEGVIAGPSNAWIKRIHLNMMPGLKFPYKAHPRSNVMPVFIVEQDTPYMTHSIRADMILAVHKCLGPAPPETTFVPFSSTGRGRSRKSR